MLELVDEELSSSSSCFFFFFFFRLFERLFDLFRFLSLGRLELAAEASSSPNLLAFDFFCEGSFPSSLATARLVASGPGRANAGGDARGVPAAPSPYVSGTPAGGASTLGTTVVGPKVTWGFGELRRRMAANLSSTGDPLFSKGFSFASRGILGNLEVPAHLDTTSDRPLCSSVQPIGTEVARWVPAKSLEVSAGLVDDGTLDGVLGSLLGATYVHPLVF